MAEIQLFKSQAGHRRYQAARCVELTDKKNLDGTPHSEVEDYIRENSHDLHEDDIIIAICWNWAGDPFRIFNWRLNVMTQPVVKMVDGSQT